MSSKTVQAHQSEQGTMGGLLALAVVPAPTECPLSPRSRLLAFSQASRISSCFLVPAHLVGGVICLSHACLWPPEL